MTNLRWIGGAALAGLLGCSGESFTTAPDGSTAPPDDGPVPLDGSPTADASDASKPTDSGPTDAGSADAPASTDGAGPTDAGCVKGIVNFEIQAAPGSTTAYCLGAPGSCSSNWLGIRLAGGTDLGLSMICEADCHDCQPVACANLCAVTARLGDGGAQTSWDGNYFASSTCGAGTACVNEACAPAGNYVASFCGYATSADASAFECIGSSSPTCTDVPFMWPLPAGSAPIVGIIGGTTTADAGACCPVGWGLSSCTFPDGGSGHQCHNPALGCASSTTCGQGCDTVVTGRCDGG
jgi:hypothetical protein